LSAEFFIKPVDTANMYAGYSIKHVHKRITKKTNYMFISDSERFNTFITSTCTYSIYSTYQRIVIDPFYFPGGSCPLVSGAVSVMTS